MSGRESMRNAHLSDNVSLISGRYWLVRRTCRWGKFHPSSLATHFNRLLLRLFSRGHSSKPSIIIYALSKRIRTHRRASERLASLLVLLRHFLIRSADSCGTSDILQTNSESRVEIKLATSWSLQEQYTDAAAEFLISEAQNAEMSSVTVELYNSQLFINNSIIR